VGYQVIFPIAGVAGVVSGLMFLKMKVRDDRVVSNAPRQSPLSALKAVSGNRRFLVYQLGVVLFGLAGLSANPLYPSVQINQLGLSYTDLGLLGLVQSISWLLGYMFWGRIADQFGGLRCTTITFALQAIAPFTYAIATTGWMLIPAFIGIGLVSAGADISLTSSCLELSDPDHTQEYAAAQSTVIGLRGFVAPYLGVGLLALGLSLPVIFTISGLLAIASVLVTRKAERMETISQTSTI
jgi:MFS family permease